MYQNTRELKSGKRGFQAGTLSNKKDIGNAGQRLIPAGTRSGRQYTNRRDW